MSTVSAIYALQLIDSLQFFLVCLKMKKYPLFLILILFSLYGNSYGFDIKGLQPIDPYGVFYTFSADSLSRGKVALSTGAEVSIEPDFYRFFFKSAYGITDSIELNLTVPYTFGANVTDGFEDIAFGVKHRFFDEGKYGPSLAYILTASIPSGRNEFTTDGRFGIGLIVSKKVGPFNGHLNFFYERPNKRSLDNEISFLAGLEFAAAHNFKILTELDCKKSHFSDKIDSVEGRIGYRIKTTDYIYTTVGAGFDFNHRSPEARLLFTVTFLSPSGKKKVKKIYEEEE